MATAESSIGQPPAGLAGNLECESAQVIPLRPFQSEEGFLKPPDTLESTGILSRIGRTASQAFNLATWQPHLNSEAMPKGVVVSENGQSSRFLVTEPREGVDPTDAPNIVFHPGLTEFGDLGSALRLHVSYAERHPDQRVITKPTVGVSHSGEIISTDEIRNRRIENMAAANLRRLRYVVQDGEVILAGTSLGTNTVIHMAEQDVAANYKDRLNLQGLVLLSSAVVALNVEESENFRHPDLDEDEHREYLTAQFFDHIPRDLAQMMRTNPLDFLSCAAIVSAYAFAPQKFLSRVKAIVSDFSNVREGIEWSTLKQIVPEVEISVLGGSEDPLTIEQKPQWDKLGALFPGRVYQRIVAGRGHLMTMDTQRTLDELDQLELQKAA